MTIGLDNIIFTIVICLLMGILAFLIMVIILRTSMNDRIEVKSRMRSMFGNRKNIIPAETVNTTKKKRIGRIKISGTLSNELQLADIPMRNEEFMMIWLLLAFVPSGIIAITSNNMILAIVVALICIALPLFYVVKKKQKKVTAFEDQLSDALVVMCNCLRSGLTLSQAMENIATEMSEPISKEFARVCREIKYGSTVEKALVAMSERVDSDDLSLAVSAINIQRQVGGNLSTVLATISETIKARIKLKREIKVLTATGRASGFVIGILPIGMGVLLMVINPGYMKLFFENSLGRGMLILGAVMEIIGILVVRKIVTIKY